MDAMCNDTREPSPSLSIVQFQPSVSACRGQTPQLGFQASSLLTYYTPNHDAFSTAVSLNSVLYEMAERFYYSLIK